MSFFLLIIAILVLFLASIPVQGVDKGTAVFDPEAPRSPVCSFCNCDAIPLANASNAVHASVVSAESEEWKPYRVQNTTDVPFGMFFRSTNASCQVEIKLTAFSVSGYASRDLLVFPFGRQNLNVVQAAVSNAPDVCPPLGSHAFVRLGKSALSQGNELGLQIPIQKRPYSYTYDIKLELLYRMWCQLMPPAFQRGFELPISPTDGSMERADLTSFLSDQIQPDWLLSTNISWETAKPVNCALEVTFQRAPLYTYLNQVVRIIPWMVYKLPIGVAALIEVTNTFSSLEVWYRAVDCGKNNALDQIEIVSWNDSLVFLEYSTQWRNVTRTFPSSSIAPRQFDLAILFVTTPEWPIDSFPQIFGTAESVGNPRRDWPSQLYENEFNRIFGSRLVRNAGPIVLFSEYASGVEAFRYRAVNRTQVIKVESSQAELGNWHTVSYSMDNATSFFLEFRPGNVSCFIQSQFIFPSSYLRPTYFLDPTGTSGTVSNDLNVRSLTGSLALQLDSGVLLAKPLPTILYRQVCPEMLALRRDANWSYYSVSVEQHPVLMLPALPASSGLKCRYQISGIGVRVGDMADFQVVCLFLNQTAEFPQRSLGSHVTLTPPQSIDLVECTRDRNNASVYIQANPNWSMFAYRMVCVGDPGANSSTAPYPVSAWPILAAANGKWHKLVYSNLRLPLTVMAVDQDCQIEIEFEYVDLFNVAIYEDFAPANNDGSDPSFFNDRYRSDGGARFQQSRYTSCSSRVILKAKYDVYYPVIGKHSRFRQVCNLPKPSMCMQELAYNVSNPEWQTLEGSAINVNQMLRTKYRLNPVFTSRDQVLEVEFTSLVSQIWLVGVVREDRYGGSYVRRETHHGVMIDSKYPAIVGKQFMFKRSITLAAGSLFNIKPGDHWFVLRYRLVPFGVAKNERDLGEVLIANDKPQELVLRIPKQFLQDWAMKAQTENYSDDDYLSSGKYDVWSYQHRYTIRPASSECRLVLRFTKIDIGPGYVSRDPLSGVNQDRLSVVRDSLGVTSKASKECFSSLTHNFTNGHWTEPICARLGQTYATPRNNASLMVLFKSLGLAEEYEYESGRPEGFSFSKHTIRQETWGSGWIAAYYQVCSEKRISNSLYPIPKVLKARHQKQVFMPLMPSPSTKIKKNSPKLQYFLDERWVIIPVNRSHCRVRVSVKTQHIRALATASYNTPKVHGFWLFPSYRTVDFSGDIVTLILTREAYSSEFPEVHYFQDCLQL